CAQFKRHPQTSSPEYSLSLGTLASFQLPTFPVTKGPFALTARTCLASNAFLVSAKGTRAGTVQVCARSPLCLSMPPGTPQQFCRPVVADGIDSLILFRPGQLSVSFGCKHPLRAHWASGAR